jgi:hypothetical protein
MTSSALYWLQSGTGRIQKQKQYLFLLLALLALPNVVRATDCLVSPTLPCTFTLTEPFNGANWPTQPIDFRYDGGFALVKNAKMVNGGGTEIPFQWVSSCWDPTAILGCIEIQDALPAGGTQSYTLEAGPASASVTNPVVVNGTIPCYSGGATCIQISNGLTGIQVPTVTSNGSSALYRLAPIQACGLPGGGWTCAIGNSGNPNLIYAEATAGMIPGYDNGHGTDPLHTPISTATGYSTKFLEYGPLKTVLQLSYTFNRPDYFLSTSVYKFNYPTTCTPANGTYPTGYVSFADFDPPAGGTILFNRAGFCSVGTGSAPLDTAHYYTATKISGVPHAYSLTTVVGGVVTPVTITGTVTGAPLAAFIVDSATGCSNGCQNSSAGHLTVTLTLYANAKSFQITEDSDMQHAEFYPFYNEINPDTARFRNSTGLSSGLYSSTDPRCGYSTPRTVTTVGTGATTATITVSSGFANGKQVLLTGVGSGSYLPNGIYYMQTTSPYSSTTPGVWTSYNGTTFSGATSAPGSYAGGGLAKVAAISQNSPVYDNGFDFPWLYGDTGFAEADPTYSNYTVSPYQYPFTGCSVVGGHLTSMPNLIVDYEPSDYANVSAWTSYQSTGLNSSPVLGLYTGDSSLMLNSRPATMPGLYVAASGFVSGWGRTTAIQDMNLINFQFPTVDNYGARKSWAIYADTVSNLPAFSSSTHPPIQDDQNKYTGVNLSHVYAYHGSSTSAPAGGWKWLYMANSNATNAGQEMTCLIARVQSNSNCAGLFPDGRVATPASGSSNAYYNILYNSATDNTSRAILNMWQSELMSGSSAVGTAINASGCPTTMSNVGTLLSEGDNHLDNRYSYYQIAVYLDPCFPFWNAVLMDSNSTSLQRSQMATEAGTFGGIMWDNSWFPIDNYSGDGYGLANQYTQYIQDRANIVYQYGVNGANSLLASKSSTAISSTAAQLQSSIGCQGAVIAGTHYMQAYNTVLIPNAEITALQGLTSFANQCQYNQGYPEWFLATTTPPDPRYYNLRKKFADGDTTSEEGDAFPGMLAAALYGTNATQAGWMSWLWHQYGSSNFQYINDIVTGLLQIDETIPQVTPSLTSQQIDGDFAVQRVGTQGGDQETVLWFINGGNAATQPIYYSLQGHRHYDDGNVTIFALGAPLSMDWGANLYYPATPDRFDHSSVTFDGEIPSGGCSAGSGCTWSSNGPKFTANGVELLNSPTVTAFQAFGSSTQSAANFTYGTNLTGGDGTVWTRTVRTMAPDASYPIIYVKDTFTGGSGGYKTLTWNLEATGAVGTPSGSKMPTTSFSIGCNVTPGVVWPSANDTSGLAPYSLANGLQQFSFTGFTWPQYAGRNLKWNLYERPTSGNAQWLIGNWGHSCGGSGYEVSEFQTANASASWFNIGGGNYCVTGNTAPFCDWQHILRVHDNGPFETVITPTIASGTQPLVSYGNGVYTATFGSDESLIWNDSYSAFTNGMAQILTTYNGSTQSAFGMTASGGPQEIANNGAGTVTWTIEDVNPATRSLKLPPGVWYPSVPVQQSAGVYTYYHGGGAEPSPAIIIFTQTPVTLRSVPLNYSPPLGAVQVRVKFGSSTNYAAIAACNPLCSIVMESPVGTWPEQHDFLDSNGNVIASSQVRSVVVQ